MSWRGREQARACVDFVVSERRRGARAPSRGVLRSYDDKYALANRATLSTISALLAAFEVFGMNSDVFQEIIQWSLANKSVSLRLVSERGASSPNFALILACAAARGRACLCVCVFVVCLRATRVVVRREVHVRQEARTRRRNQPGDDRVRNDGHEHHDVHQGKNHAQAIR